MKGVYARSCDEALVLVLDPIPDGATIGRGDSRTLREVAFVSALREGDYGFVDRRSDEYRDSSITKRVEISRTSVHYDVFLTGSNAITVAGELVNVDSVGNRVAPLLFGPRSVIVIAGENKLARDEKEAPKRIQQIAAPRNASRYGYELPCAKTRMCNDCSSQERVCRPVVIVKRDSGRVL